MARFRSSPGGQAKVALGRPHRIRRCVCSSSSTPAAVPATGHPWPGFACHPRSSQGCPRVTASHPAMPPLVIVNSCRRPRNRPSMARFRSSPGCQP
jgi:hypothetical protein